MKFTSDNPTLINDSLVKIDDDACRLSEINSDSFKFYSLVPPIALQTMNQNPYPEEYKEIDLKAENKGMITLENGSIFLGNWFNDKPNGFGILNEISKR